ncbi:hypothetical protein HHO41_04835 [Bacillus sp. DNRA2]|uniref:hypothetical protein n=1 Tax=Bacillus sp. DNRA2 TaxID=2723053 RepID=UPI00145E4C7A|nr:hypothetical protein [Bacillus sp. DNRA2]NMD69606.1 hypothetical protein [Bacillus sp. DNRA2]
MKLHELVEIYKQVEEAKKELFSAKLRQFEHLDEHLIGLLQRAASHDTSLLDELESVIKEAK